MVALGLVQSRHLASQARRLVLPGVLVGLFYFLSGSLLLLPPCVLVGLIYFLSRSILLLKRSTSISLFFCQKVVFVKRDVCVW